MVNVLMLSKWHVHAEGYAGLVQKLPYAKITAVFDEDKERGAAWAKKLGADFEPSLLKALARKDVDAVVVDSATSDHIKYIPAAADAGKHVFTEKAMALTVKDCKEIEKHVKAGKGKFVISFPNLVSPVVRLCKELLDSGCLGKPHYMRSRNAHNGSLGGWLPDYWYDIKKAGGGAMMDLGCHPMYTGSYLLGKPKRITAVFNTTIAPQGDDNASATVEFENKAIAVLETSFISPYNSDCFEFLGTEGAVVQSGGQIRVRSNKFKGGWYTPDKLPPPMPIPLEIWLDCIEKKKPVPPEFAVERGTALTELLENAYIANKTGKTVVL